MGNSWQVAENGDFEQVDELTAGAQLIKRTLDGWLDTVSQEQRERAIDQIYGIFAAAGYGNIADLVEHWTDSLPKIVEAARNTDRETRGLIRAVIKAIPVSAAKAVRELKRLSAEAAEARAEAGLWADATAGRDGCRAAFRPIHVSRSSKRREKWNCDT